MSSTTTPTDHRGASRLRPLEPADAPSLARHADDRGVWLNLRDRFPHPYRLQDAEAFIAHARAQERPTIHAIEVDGRAVGCITLVPGTDIERLSAEIGYWLGRELWGRGVATEAVRAATRHAFAVLGMQRVFALPFARNAASHRVLEKAGFLVEGTLRHAAIKDGELLDQRLYAACADRWTGAPADEATR